MAVQPDPRSVEAQAAERGMDLVIVHQHGPYVLCRFRHDPNPASLYIRDTRPGQRLRASVWWSHQWQWSASPVSGVDLDHYLSAADAFTAWVERQP